MKPRWIATLVLLFAAGCLLIPDDQESGTRIANVRPSVRITAGAATSDSAGIDYKVLFQWLGSDVDGVVRRFEYAVDDTTTEEAWQDTTAFSAQLRFRATHQSAAEQADPFTDWHTFYIRAVDNEYATSRLDRRYFNARTIAPTSRIRFPLIPAGAADLVRTFVIEWEGEDLDSSTPERTPAAYEYKLIRMPGPYSADSVYVNALYNDPNMFLDTLEVGDKTRWIRVGGDVRERTLQDLQDTGAEVLVFGLRAIDEAGAVEPVLERGDNWIVFFVQDRTSKPNVTISERTVGRHRFMGDGDVWEVEVPSNTPIRFQWLGDAAYYGSKPGNVNYGLDVPDPQNDRYRDPKGIGGWIGWGKWEELVTPLIFPDSDDGQTHLFYLRMRDIGDKRSSERLCTVLIKVVAFTFERTAMLVDDARVGYRLGLQQDEIHDEFIYKFVNRIYDFAPQGITERSMYRPRNNNREGLSPSESQALPLSELARHEALLWNFNYAQGQTTGIWFHEHETPVTSTAKQTHLLTSYVKAGGKLFLFGGRYLTAMMSTYPISYPQLSYPKIPPQGGISDMDFTESSFVYRLLHVRNQVVGIDALHCYSTPPDDHQPWRDGLIGCMSTNPAYPDLVLDPAKHDTEASRGCPQSPPPPEGGISDFEGLLFDRQYSPFYPEAGLDTLYVSEHYSWYGTPPSKWNGSVIAQRYESTPADTIAGREQGRVIMFMFQPYPFMEGPAIDAGTAAINWLMTGQDY